MVTSRRTGNIKGGVEHQRRGEEIKDFRVWLTYCVVTSWKDLQLKIIHFYKGIATFETMDSNNNGGALILGSSRNINPSKEWQHLVSIIRFSVNIEGGMAT